MVTPRKPRLQDFTTVEDCLDAKVDEIADPGATLTGKLDSARVLFYTQA